LKEDTLKKTSAVLMILILGLWMLAGCGHTNPVAPKTQASSNGSKTVQTFRPSGVIYEGRFGGTPTIKPWYWTDAADVSSYNATILTMPNGQSARIKRVNGSTWGKISTFPISYANTANATVNVRFFVTSHSSSMAWKLEVQEQGGAWRNWVLRNSSGDTGYTESNLTSILAAVNAGSGSFTLEIVVEGAVDEYLEAAELYVYNTSAAPNLSAAYWEEWFSYYIGNHGHTAGWFDETTNPGFHAIIENVQTQYGHIQGDAVLGGKVMSPVLPWSVDRCKVCQIGVSDAGAKFSVYIQEQSGQYRQWQIPLIYVTGGNYFQGDISTVPLAAGAPFSLTISDVFGDIWINGRIRIQ
jgi:hypothetical protein